MNIAAGLSALMSILALSKTKKSSYELVRCSEVMHTLVIIAGTVSIEGNRFCSAILTNLTRYTSNRSHLVFKIPKLINVLVKEMTSKIAECRKFAIFSLQNLSCDCRCHQKLAATPYFLSSVTKLALDD